MINLSHLGWPPAFWYPILFLHGSVLGNSMLESYQRLSHGVKCVWFDMFTIHTSTLYGRPSLNVHFPPYCQWKWFFGTIRTPNIIEISWYQTSCLISLTALTPLWKVGRRDRDDHFKLDPRHWEKDHFWNKSYYARSVAHNVANRLIFYMPMLHDISTWYWQTYFKERV